MIKCLKSARSLGAVTMKINLYEMFCTDTLRHRETAREIIEEISRRPRSKSIIIDFAKIEFASRSFLHELISHLGDKQVKFKNRNQEVVDMMTTILQGDSVNLLQNWNESTSTFTASQYSRMD
jgi:hypothetical protein